ncbi:tetracycline resistance MFS efflux pump [Jeotgalibacillus soli]|uniref:Multidrug transporter n=1 Tax=Jeotgalibacillus soli TaxID=889306 RepID=A0A0C2VNL8_9BACL|nr:tetracycline resistance MFS efflux pump [Jeotgalibacillus soli]KIL45593.1 multidrug transporter [Jeotgalibacillus soli]
MQTESVKENSNRAPLFLLSFNLFIVMVGIGLVIPILPFYVEKFNANAQTLGFLVAVFAFMQFLFAPIWGRLSDKIGRKPLITIGLIGFAIAEFIFAFATGLWMLFISRILAGIFGSALMPTAMAYVSDVTDDKSRGQGMGILGAAMGLGIVVGPGIGGWLAEFDLSYPFLFAGIAASLAAVVSTFLLPESFTKEQREALPLESRVGQFTQIKQALVSPVGFLLILVFIMSFGLANFQAVFGYYALERYGYGPQQVGFTIFIVGIVGTLVQGIGVGRMTKRFGEEKVVTIAMVISAFGFVIMTLAANFTMVIITTGIFFIGNSLLRPSLNALISKLAGPRQGMVMGLNNSFLSLGNVAGPILAGTLFLWNIHIPYLFGASIMIIGLIATRIWIAKKPRD